MKGNEKTMVIGCDISKEKIDVAYMDKPTKEVVLRKVVRNSKRGFKEIIKSLAGKKPIKRKESFHVVLEATGNYHLRFIGYLEQEGISYSVINPLKIKRYGQSKMLRIKSDKADAELIALYGAEQSPKESKSLEEYRRRLKSYTTVRASYVKQLTAMRNLLHSQRISGQSDERILRRIKSTIKGLKKVIKKLDKEMEEIIKGSGVRDVYERLLSIKGIGKVTAIGIIAYLGDLRDFKSSKQVASYIGITPKIMQSGKSLNNSLGITKQGNSRLRTLFYLASLSASRSNNACKSLYKRLLSRGKQKKTALIAVSNKLVRQVFAIVKHERVFQNDYVCNA
jgi:transposase